jgi:hypothetical protein
VLQPAPTPLCTFEGQSYNDGEEWRPDDCTRCLCDRGTINCETVSGCGTSAGATELKSESQNGGLDCQYVVCPEIDCATQSYVPLGQCCPVCAGETIFDRTRGDTYRWWAPRLRISIFTSFWRELKLS